MLGDAVTCLFSQAPVTIMEDVVGDVHVKGAESRALPAGDGFLAEFDQAVEAGMSSRKQSATKKNDRSSRSHAVLRITVKNAEMPSSSDGLLYLIDLAGAERHVDSAEHDVAQLGETLAINSSLLTLKECVRARARGVADIEKHVHIPYRRSKLTLLLKEAFALEVMRVAKTCVIGCCSPSVADYSASIATMRFISEMREAMGLGAGKSVGLEPDTENPVTWDHAMLAEYFLRVSKGKLVLDTAFSETATGLDLIRMPERTFIQNVMAVCTCPACLLCFLLLTRLVFYMSFFHSLSLSHTHTHHHRPLPLANRAWAVARNRAGACLRSSSPRLSIAATRSARSARRRPRVPHAGRTWTLLQRRTLTGRGEMT